MSEKILFIDLNDYAETELQNKDKEIQRLNTIITNQNRLIDYYKNLYLHAKEGKNGLQKENTNDIN